MSCPAMAVSITATSQALRACGPTWSRLGASGTQPAFETRPYVGLSPVCPFAAAGALTEPPVSVPSPQYTIPADTAIPVPEDEPEGLYSGFHGLRGMGEPFDTSGRPPIENSLSTVLPMRTAPALRILATTGASRPAP